MSLNLVLPHNLVSHFVSHYLESCLVSLSWVCVIFCLIFLGLGILSSCVSLPSTSLSSHNVSHYLGSQSSEFCVYLCSLLFCLLSYLVTHFCGFHLDSYSLRAHFVTHCLDLLSHYFVSHLGSHSFGSQKKKIKIVFPSITHISHIREFGDNTYSTFKSRYTTSTTNGTTTIWSTTTTSTSTTWIGSFNIIDATRQSRSKCFVEQYSVRNKTKENCNQWQKCSFSLIAITARENCCLFRVLGVYSWC